MADIIKLFAKGVQDSLRFLQGTQDVLASWTLLKRTLQITGINGVIYLGSVSLYSFFSISFFS